MRQNFIKQIQKITAIGTPSDTMELALILNW